MATLLIIGFVLVLTYTDRRHDAQAEAKAQEESLQVVEKPSSPKVSKRDKLKPRNWHVRKRSREVQALGEGCEGEAAAPPPYVELPAVC
ncbi:hypothetical protein BJX76DRAFT_343836 [Aspergillus varians]